MSIAFGALLNKEMPSVFHRTVVSGVNAYAKDQGGISPTLMLPTVDQKAVSF